MANEEHFDVVILGSGQAAGSLLGFLTSTGKRVALIEQKAIGGACANTACMPTKQYVHLAEVVHHAREQYSKLTLETIPGYRAVRDQKNATVQMRQKSLTSMFSEAGASVIFGRGRFLESKWIEILREETNRIVTADKVIIDVGTTANIPHIPGLRAAKPLTRVELLELGEIPTHLIILGGGYVGLEFAQILVRLGATVSVINRGDRILKNEDEDVSAALQEILEVEGVKFYLSAEPKAVNGLSGDQVEITVSQKGTNQSISGSHILCATGRVPNTADIGFQNAGIGVDARGYIKVDEYLRTEQDGVFAAGECAGSPQFTHVSLDDGRVLISNFSEGERQSTTHRLIPSTLFTSPELAHVGAREQQLKKKAIAYRVGRVPAGVVPRNIVTGATQGFLKVLVGSHDDKILGFTALCAYSGEMLLTMQLAIKHGLPYTTIRDTMICHPTHSEGLGAALGAVPDKAEH